MTPCQFHPDALDEADQAAEFYRSQQAGLEIRFLDALNDAITRIRSHPERYRRIAGNIRKCRLPRFPYGVIYRVGDQRIEVIAVMHLRKRPGYWTYRT